MWKSFFEGRGKILLWENFVFFPISERKNQPTTKLITFASNPTAKPSNTGIKASLCEVSSKNHRSLQKNIKMKILSKSENFKILRFSTKIDDFFASRILEISRNFIFEFLTLARKLINVNCSINQINLENWLRKSML